MQVFGMASEDDDSLSRKEESFDYLKEATASNDRDERAHPTNDSVSFLLDASAIAEVPERPTSSPTTAGKFQRQTFFSFQDASVSQFLVSSSPTKASRKSQPPSKENSTAVDASNHHRLDRFRSKLQLPRASLDGGTSEKKPLSQALSSNEVRAPPTPVLNRPSTQPSITLEAKTPSSLGNTIQSKSTNKDLEPEASKIPSKTSLDGSKPFDSGAKSQKVVSPPKVPQTPGGFWTINTESKSFVNGLLSPFSPLLHSSPNDKENGHLETIRSFDMDDGDQEHPQRKEYLQFVSLQPCRKVSVVVKVAASEDEEAKRCIFPHYREKSTASIFSTPSGKNGADTPLSKKKVVVVNPKAFGKKIPSKITMETARLVAQVANISSDDWARLYNFQHVMWPKQGDTGGESDKDDAFDTMDSVTRAVVQDLLAEHKSSLLISMGHESSCFKTSNNIKNQPNEAVGLWTKIINQCSLMLETKGVVRLTMFEILEPTNGRVSGTHQDSFRDLLAPSNKKATPIQLRHVDMKGAILKGLVEVEIDSMSVLLEALSRIRRKRSRKSLATSAVTAVVGTLYYWEDSLAYKLKRPHNGTVTCVELATPSNSLAAPNRDSITHRKSIVSLGQALRQLLLQQAAHQSQSAGPSVDDENYVIESIPVFPYRETTLTKVLQRFMESSKIVLIASISQLSKDYDQTLATLNYLRKLLVKPGKPFSSPFQSHEASSGTGLTTPKTDKRNNLTDRSMAILSSPEAKENEELLQQALSENGVLMKQLLADPRQRLAKVLQIGTPVSKASKTSSRRLEDPSTSFISTLDASTVGSKEDANSYKGPPIEDESRQGVESPILEPSAWRETTEIHATDHGSGNGDDQDSYSQQSIEQDLLRLAKEKAVALQNDDAQKSDILPKNTIRDLPNNPSANSSQYDLPPSPNPNKSKLDSQELEPVEQTIHVDEREFQHEHEHGLNDEELEMDEGIPNESFSENTEEDYDGEEDLEDEELEMGQGLPEQSYYEDAEEDYNEDEDRYLTPEQTNGGRRLPEENEEINHLESSSTSGSDPIGRHLEGGLDQETGKIDESHQMPEEDDDATLDLKPLADEEDEDWEEEQEHADTSVAASVKKPTALNFLDPNYNEDSMDSGMNQTDYDLPEEPLGTDALLHRSYVRSPRSPHQKRGEFNSFASPYSVTLKTTQSKEYLELQSERDALREKIQSLEGDLQRVSADRDHQVEELEEKLKQFHTKLLEAHSTKAEVEKAAQSEALAREEELKEVANARETLERQLESLGEELAEVSETHEDAVRRHHEEIEALHATLTTEREKQRSIEKIADEVAEAHKTQAEEIRILAEERDGLQETIETMKTNIRSLEKDQGDNTSKYQQEIRQLYNKLNEITQENQALQQTADDARFEVENKSEKIRLMEREREEFQSNLSALKVNAKKASEDHDDYTRRFQDEIQQLREKLNIAVKDKLEVEQAADEVRFSNDELEQTIKNLEEELSSSRATNSRLEDLQKEHQETMRAMTAELRRKDEEKIDIQHHTTEIQRLKRHSNHLESIMAHRQAEYSTALTELEDDLAKEKLKNLRLEEDLDALQKQVSVLLEKSSASEDELRFANESNSKLLRDLDAKNEILKRLQSSNESLEALRVSDQDAIARLHDDLRDRESESLHFDQLQQKMARLQQDRDRLQDLVESRRDEYEACIEDRETKITSYASKLDVLEKEFEEVKSTALSLKNESKAQSLALQETKSKLKERDSKISSLETEIETQKEELSAMRRKESKVSHSDRETRHLKDRLSSLESALQTANTEKEDVVRRLRNETHAKQSILEDLERYKEDVRRYKRAFLETNEKLDQREHDDNRVNDVILKMESSLQSLKKEAKDRNNSFIDRTKEFTSKNEAHGSSVREMAERVRERHQDMFMTPQSGDRLRKSAPRSAHTTPSNVLGTSDAPKLFGGRPGVQVTKYHLGDQGGENAEDIAICVALSAKRAMADESSKELSLLRSQVYRLEDERSEQVFALKSRVRDLQRELSYERAVNGTPVMGSRSANRRSSYMPESNYFATEDEEKYGY